MGKSGRGAYVGLTMLNPQFVSLDMRRIRCATYRLLNSRSFVSNDDAPPLVPCSYEPVQPMTSVCTDV